MVGTYSDWNTAFAALEEECKKPRSSTMRSRKEAAKVAGKVAGGIAAAASGGFPVAIAIPITLPALPPLVSMIAGVTQNAVTSGAAALLQFEDDRDIQRAGLGLGGESHALLRESIQSILQPGKTLHAIAGDRAGTHGSVQVKELLPLMMAHYHKARHIWDEEPFKGGISQAPLASCHDAELLYRKHVEVDYHLSKMKAYAEALKRVADDYVAYCNRNAEQLRASFDIAKDRAKDVLRQSEDWHRESCGVAEHCYRTTKWSRLF